MKALEQAFKCADLLLQGSGGFGVIILVPECDTEDQAVEYLGESAGTIFEEHLDGWCRVPTVWPPKRDLATFQRWFEFSFHSMIVDLCDDVLEHEEL